MAAKSSQEKLPSSGTNGPLPDGSVTAVMINFNTADLTRRAVASFRRAYPDVPLLLIDNGSEEKESASLLAGLEADERSAIAVVRNDRNLHHGPAMDQGLRHAGTPYVLFLESDCDVVAGGFLEAMIDRAESDPACYAVGHRVMMDARGFDLPPTGEHHPGAAPYIRPYCMLIRRAIYLALPPFRKHGTPCLENMRAAAAKGYGLVEFPVLDFVRHAGRGTAGRHGYRLGVRGRLNYILHKLGL